MFRWLMRMVRMMSSGRASDYSNPSAAVCSTLCTPYINNMSENKFPSISLDLYSSSKMFRFNFNFFFAVASILFRLMSMSSFVVAYTQFALKRSNIAARAWLPHELSKALSVRLCPKYRKMLVWQIGGATSVVYMLRRYLVLFSDFREFCFWIRMDILHYLRLPHFVHFISQS